MTVVRHCGDSDGHTDAQSNRRANWLRFYVLTNARRYRCGEHLVGSELNDYELAAPMAKHDIVSANMSPDASHDMAQRLAKHLAPVCCIDLHVLIHVYVYERNPGPMERSEEMKLLQAGKPYQLVSWHRTASSQLSSPVGQQDRLGARLLRSPFDVPLKMLLGVDE